MDKIAISFDRAAMRLAVYGLSNQQARAALAQCPIAATYNGAPYFYPEQIDETADSYISALSLDCCKGID